MQLTFKLEDFEGPLDLLLYLLEKNKMSIYDIEISAITSQYLAYLEEGKDLPLDQMSEFIVMASTLLYIKSKMLLPRPKKEELIEEDPREELMRKLIEYKKIKYVSHELNDRQGQVTNYCFRNKEIDLEIPFEKPEVEDVLHGVSLQQLYEVFQGLIKENNLLQVEKDRQIDAQIIRKDTYTIAKKSEYLLNLLKVKGELSFFSLCQLGMPKIELIVTFMSLLELVHKKQVIIWQERPLDDIMIRGVTANEKN